MKRYTIMALAALPLFLNAQNASIQDCLGAIPVCQKIYVEAQAPIGFGNRNDIDGFINCVPSEQNSIWYVFTVDKSGQFGFLLTPNDPADDYDWSLFNITEASCEEIRTDPSLLVSCNAAGGSGCDGATGATGATAYDLQGLNCGNEPATLFSGFSTFNDLIDVEAGNTYVLFINNFSGSTNGYTLDFGLSGDIGIFDETDPELETAALADACDGASIRLEFSEFIQCPTIADFNFQLDGPGGPHTLTLSSINCDAGGNYAKEFFLEVTPSLSDGNYQLSLDVDTFSEALDLCDNPAIPTALSLTGPTATPTIDLGNDTTLCAGESLILNAGQLAGTYLWNDGSTGPILEVSAAGTYSVEVNTGCGIATDAIEVSTGPALAVDLGPDIVLCPAETATLDATAPGATYLWNDGSTSATLPVSQAGTYAVTVTNGCGMAEDSLAVTIVAPVTATLQDAALCPEDNFTWDVTTPDASYLWQDGSTDPTFTATAAGTYSVTITTTCETVVLSAEVSSGESLTPVDLGSDTTLCSGETYTLTLDYPGANFLWQDGSTTNSFTVMQPGNYAVTVSNDCSQQQGALEVDYAAPIDADIENADLCPGETVTWNVTTPNATYRWQDGSTGPDFTVAAAGNYAVTITTDCETVTRSAEVTSEGSLAPVSLGSDTTLCPGETYTINLNYPDADFLWQDGSATNSFTVTQPGNYAVTVTNGCDQQQGALEVDYAAPIDADIENADLCPGETVTWNVTTPNATYRWQDGSTGPDFTAAAAGNYAVTITTDCETVTRSAEVASEESLPPLNLGSDTTLCPGETYTINLNYPGADLLWQDGSTASSYLITQSGAYALTIANACDTLTDEIQVQVLDPIVLDLGPDTVLCAGASLLLDANDRNISYYRWQDNSNAPTLLVDGAGLYTLTAGNACEEVYDEISVRACEDCNIFVPNAFSPNNDGVNDRFKPFANCTFLSYQLMIFDRWGTLLYESQDAETGWDGAHRGRTAPEGVYIWAMTISIEENNEMKEIRIKGEVTLSR